MTNYGQKGGTSPTSGLKAETIVAEFCGQRFTKRVFHGQRYITVLQSDATAEPLVQAWGDHAKAQQYCLDAAARYPAAFVLDARPA